MPYWLTNPAHGVMPAYDMGEVERNKLHGWTLLNVGESPVFPVEEVSGEENPVERPAEEPQKRKPGRPRKV